MDQTTSLSAPAMEQGFNFRAGKGYCVDKVASEGECFEIAKSYASVVSETEMGYGVVMKMKYHCLL